MCEAFDSLRGATVADIQFETCETQPDRPCITVLDAHLNRRNQTTRFSRLITLKQEFKIFFLPLDSFAIRLLGLKSGEMVQCLFHSGIVPGFLLLRGERIVTIRITEAGTARDY